MTLSCTKVVGIALPLSEINEAAIYDTIQAIEAHLPLPPCPLPGRVLAVPVTRSSLAPPGGETRAGG